MLHCTIALVEFGTTLLLAYLPTLRHLVLSTLEQLDLPSDHVIEARIDIDISHQEVDTSFVTGQDGSLRPMGECGRGIRTWGTER